VTFPLLVSLVFASTSYTSAGPQTGQVFIQAVHGDASYSVGAAWQGLRADSMLSPGASIKTGPEATVDLVLQYNGTVLRLLPNSELRLEKMNKEAAGEELITETSLNLVSGSLVGSQKKLASPSKLQIRLPSGVASIKGTEYVVRADGAVSVLSGSVSVNYNLPGHGGSVKVSIAAGFSFNPATGQVVPTTPAYLENLIAHINAVRQNAKVFKAGGATVVVKAEPSVSPVHGNNGVGNGVDPQPPGNPPINDGPGTSPGNPGNRGGAHP